MKQNQNFDHKSNALIVERISIFSTMRVFHSAGM